MMSSAGRRLRPGGRYLFFASEGTSVYLFFGLCNLPWTQHFLISDVETRLPGVLLIGLAAVGPNNRWALIKPNQFGSQVF